jgi:error-prone DNA polymerase
LNAEQAEALIRADALAEFGLPRRELLWQLGLLIPGRESKEPTGVEAQPAQRKARAAQLALPLPVEQDMVALPGLSAWQGAAWDYETMGVTGPRHPMALVRPLLNESLITSLHLGGVRNPNRLPQGMVVEMAGMVVTRQRPMTASGVMFLLLEDEFGLANVVVWPALQDRQRELVRGAPFVIIRGRVDTEKSGFPNIIAESFRPCPLPGLIEAPDPHNFG